MRQNTRNLHLPTCRVDFETIGTIRCADLPTLDLLLYDVVQRLQIQVSRVALPHLLVALMLGLFLVRVLSVKLAQVTSRLRVHAQRR